MPVTNVSYRIRRETIHAEKDDILNLGNHRLQVLTAVPRKLSMQGEAVRAGKDCPLFLVLELGI